MNIRFAKAGGVGIVLPAVLVVAGGVELCHSMVHFGSVVRKKSTKCCWARAWPGEPETRGVRIGARRVPLSMSKSEPPEGMAFRKLSERGVYAEARAAR